MKPQVKVHERRMYIAKFLQVTQFLYAEKVLKIFTGENSTVIFSMMMSAMKNNLAREGEAALLLRVLQLIPQKQWLKSLRP
jgi:hypothetical protein